MFGAGEIDAVDDLRGRSFSSAVGVWRVRVDGRSAVLKLLRLNAGPHEQWPSRPDPDDPYYWRREPLAYASGVLEPFGVPRVLACVDRVDGDVALWLEDVGDPLAAWTTVQVEATARRLGETQRRLLGYDAAWLAHGWLREYHRLHGVDYDARLDSLPQTVCHHDFHPNNILGAGTVIDWAFCGVGPVGSDAGTLVGDGLADGWFAPEDADAMLDAAWRGYSSGFGSADGDVRDGFVHGILRLRWLVSGRSPHRDATIALIERLASDG